jgi:hypothetical protein
MVRRRHGPGNPVPLVMLDEGERETVWQWWQLAADRLQAGPKETSWLTATIMVQMTLGYEANHGPRVPALAYAMATRTGYALRMFVGRLAAPRPLDVSSIDPESVATLATLPVDDEAGTLAGVTDEDEALLMPIVVLISETAEQTPLFREVVSVEPAIWNACVEVSVDKLQAELTQRGMIRRARDLKPEVSESFLRYGFVLRCLDEAFAINT